MFNHRNRNRRISDGSIIHTEKFFGSVQEFNGCENKDSVKHDLELMTHPDYLNDILTDNTLPTHHPFISEDWIKENGCDIVQCKYEKGSADEFTQDPGNSTATVTDAESALLRYALKSMCGAKVYKVSSYIDLFFPSDTTTRMNSLHIKLYTSPVKLQLQVTCCIITISILPKPEALQNHDTEKRNASKKKTHVYRF